MLVIKNVNSRVSWIHVIQEFPFCLCHFSVNLEFFLNKTFIWGGGNLLKA